jgi:hypothetical protein
MKKLSKTNQKENPWEIVKSFFTYNGEDYENLSPSLSNTMKDQDKKAVIYSSMSSRSSARS